MKENQGILVLGESEVYALSLGTSILNEIKSMIGPDVNYGAFDIDLKVCINSALQTLSELGVGPSSGFRITSDAESWEDFIGNRIDLESVKEYVYLRARLTFDPPTSSSVLQSFKDLVKELEWRINGRVDY